MCMEERKQLMIPRKLYKIGEIMRYTGLSRQTIHNYTTLGLITEEERTESGHRLYGEDVFARIERIKDLRRRNTLREIIQILKQETPGNPVSPA
jgi:DNA-binding transcriptional MerR regulator